MRGMPACQLILSAHERAGSGPWLMRREGPGRRGDRGSINRTDRCSPSAQGAAQRACRGRRRFSPRGRNARESRRLLPSATPGRTRPARPGPPSGQAGLRDAPRRSSGFGRSDVRAAAPREAPCSRGAAFAVFLLLTMSYNMTTSFGKFVDFGPIRPSVTTITNKKLTQRLRGQSLRDIGISRGSRREGFNVS